MLKGIIENNHLESINQKYGIGTVQYLTLIDSTIKLNLVSPLPSCKEGIDICAEVIINRITVKNQRVIYLHKLYVKKGYKDLYPHVLKTIIEYAIDNNEKVIYTSETNVKENDLLKIGFKQNSERFYYIETEVLANALE